MNRDLAYATPAQERFIARLRKEAFAKRAPVLWGTSTRRMLRSDASREIDMLKAAISKVS